MLYWDGMCLDDASSIAGFLTLEGRTNYVSLVN